jgi:hypothetical protein
MKPRRPRHIAPRLRSGDSREPIGHGLPPHIKRALKMIAAARNESLSWMLEKALIDYFGKRPPDYVSPKPPTPAQRQDDAESEARARHKRSDDVTN